MAADCTSSIPVYHLALKCPAFTSSTCIHVTCKKCAFQNRSGNVWSLTASLLPLGLAKHSRDKGIAAVHNPAPQLHWFGLCPKLQCQHCLWLLWAESREKCLLMCKWDRLSHHFYAAFCCLSPPPKLLYRAGIFLTWFKNVQAFCPIEG